MITFIINYKELIIKNIKYPLGVGESNRIWTVPEYGHSRYLRNHKSYKKKLINKIFLIK